MAAGQLNVVFHGQFAFVFTSECVEVLIPVTHGNVYRAGRRGPAVANLVGGRSYCLTGVAPASSEARLARDETAVLDGFYVINRASNALHCSLYLPLPWKMKALRCVPGGASDFFLGETARKIAAKRLALVNVFTYEYRSHADVHLGDLTWTPDANRTNNLHVVSDAPENAPPTAHHVKSAFIHLTRLFPGMRLELANEGWVAPGESGVDGINNDEDQRSLWELPAAAGHLPEAPHCISIFVDNT